MRVECNHAGFVASTKRISPIKLERLPCRSESMSLLPGGWGKLERFRLCLT